MREIKFRAWDKRKKEMNAQVTGLEFTWREGKLQYIIGLSQDSKMQDCEFEFKVKDVELMQFIGLKDKNGKEIYEGDIIKWISVGEEGGNFEDIGVETDMGNHEVVFKNGKFSTTKPDIPIGHLIKKIEVIGNKFENPELLEDKK